MSLGAGVGIALNERLGIEPELWIYRQEYIALNEFDKVVPTQIETGSAVGDIAATLSLAASVPVTFRFSVGEQDRVGVSARAGVAAVIRIPYRPIDGSEVGPVARYWASRFIYPQLGIGADLRLSDRVRIGGIADWYIPLYNAWDSDETTPFLDETMVRYGVRVVILSGPR
jgi:hypothetical protein